MDPPGLACVVEMATTLEGVLERVLLEASALATSVGDERYETTGGKTTLVVTPACGELNRDFEVMMDVMYALEDAFEDLGLAGKVQTVAFHPMFTYSGEPEDSAANFTNRSPYATFHLLRECDVERAGKIISVSAMLDTNVRTLNAIGVQKLRAKLRELRGEG
jgi:hypothetical protein